MGQAPAAISALIDRFERNRESYKSQGYNETQLRREFLDPFFEALGWDITNRDGHAEAYKDVIHEDAIKIGGVTKAPDYCFRIGGTRKFFMEAKKPSVNLKNEPAPAYQLRRYAWSAKLPLSILTDFEEFAVYDCRTRPNPSDKSSAGRILYLAYRDYLTRWDEIASIFTKDAVLKGSFDKYAGTDRKRGTATVDAEFLKEIETWREALAKNLAVRNSKLSVHELNFAVQRTIDRLIFLRICEDRSVEPYGQLQALLNGKNIYGRLRYLYEQADDRYNSGLFHFRPEKDRAESPDDLTPRLKIDDKVLKDIIGRLYYPQSPYEFSVFPTEILGQVYEQFLGKVIRLTSGHQAKVEEKPEVKKAGGVYYTPAYIVDYIVKHTVGTLCVGKTPKQIAKLRILDPACGSGSFLIGAYRYLLNYHRDWYVNDGSEKHRKELFQAVSGEWRLTAQEKKRILLNNIYGVDIDNQAVEVTKLSLLLKVLEGESDETLKRQLSFVHERALPDLGQNIKCGNSLIGPEYISGQLLPDEDEDRRINIFDWKTQFSKILEAGGFNVIIGNPPFLSSDNIPDNIKGYLDHNFPKVSQHRYDLACVFLEQSIRLSRSGALIGLLQPSHVLTGEYFSPARKLLVSDLRLENIVDFRETAFEQVANPICSIIATKEQCSKPYSFTVLDPRSALDNSTAKNWQKDITTVLNDSIINAAGKTIPSYRFILSRSYDLMAKRTAGCPSLSSLGLVTDGIQTADLLHTIFVQQPKNRDGYVKALRSGKDIPCRYGHVKWDGWYVLKPALCQKYKRPGFNYGSERRLEVFSSAQKIILRQTEPTIVATIDTRGFYSPNSIFHIKVTNENYSPYYVLGLLNSKFLRTMYAEATQKRGTTKPQIYLNPLKMLPISPINFSDSTDKSEYDQMVSLVDRMLDLHRRLSETKMPTGLLPVSKTPS